MERLTGTKDPLIIAHRGASSEAPENSLASYRLAWEQKADAIEIDLRKTKDGIFICAHDNNFNRVSSSKKNISGFTNLKEFVKNIESEKSADALAELNEDLREKILKKLSPTEIANEIEELDTDDAADMIAELSSERKEKVMSKITDSNHLKDIKELLTYSEDTAGAIMAKELVKVKESLSVLKCIDYMRAQAENVTRVHSIYVVDMNDKLLGRLSLKDLLTADSKAEYTGSPDIGAICGSLLI